MEVAESFIASGASCPIGGVESLQRILSEMGQKDSLPSAQGDGWFTIGPPGSGSAGQFDLERVTRTVVIRSAPGYTGTIELVMPQTTEWATAVLATGGTLAIHQPGVAALTVDAAHSGIGITLSPDRRAIGVTLSSGADGQVHLIIVAVHRGWLSTMSGVPLPSQATTVWGSEVPRAIPLNLACRQTVQGVLEGYARTRPLQIVHASISMMDGLLDQATHGLQDNDGGMWGFGAVSRALDYIHAADPGQLSVRQISRHAGMSESRLRQLFREYTGRPVGEFVANLRLDRAYQLIAEDGATVSDASLQVGYSNIGYFSRRFRDRFGMLPSTLKRAVDVSVIARRFDARHTTSLAV